MYMIEELLGQAAAPAAPNLLDPSQIPDVHGVPGVHPAGVPGEPGARVRGHSGVAVAHNPTTWLVGTLALGIALFAYGTNRIG